MKNSSFIQALLISVAALLGNAGAEDVTPGAGDPALELRAPAVTAENEKAVRGWFKELGSDDFDARDAARAKLVAAGPGVIPIAKEFFNDPDPEIASSAKSLRSKIYLKYDGFLPVDPVLRSTLDKPLAKKMEWVKDGNNSLQPILTIIEICKASGIKVEVDAGSVNAQIALPGGDPTVFVPLASDAMTLLQRVSYLANVCEAVVIPRGDTVLITSAENAKRLSVQRFAFDWSVLELSRDDAARIEKELAPFLAPGTEVHAASSALVISGTEESIQRTARLIASLRRNAADAIWPHPEKVDDAALLAKVSTPAPMQISTQNPFQVAATIRAAKHDVYVQTTDGRIVSVLAPSPENWAIEMATLNLNVTQGAMPLGLVLRWCERRARMIDFQQMPVIQLVYTVAADGRIVVQLHFAASPTTDAVGGADVAFLYAKANDYSETTDAAARKQLIEALEPHLDLFPKIDLDSHFRVIRGRLLMQGCSASLRRALLLVGEWRASGKPPGLPAWRTEMESTLNAPVDWDGRGLTAGKVLTMLRKTGKVNVLLEDSPNSAAHFELAPKDAELLPPGRYAFKELLNDLAARTKAKWRVEFGAIVITP